MRRKIIAILTSISSSAAFIYLIYWDRLGLYPGMYAIELFPLFCTIILAFTLIIAAILAISKRKYILLGLFPLISLVYFLRLVHGEKVATFEGCDMSICDNLSLYSDGTYYFISSSQIETLKHWGTYRISNDTILFSRIREFPKVDKRDIELIKLNDCFHIESESFRMQIGNRLCKN